MSVGVIAMINTEQGLGLVWNRFLVSVKKRFQLRTNLCETYHTNIDASRSSAISSAEQTV